ncbi:choice-of-anchor L domain-containing protein [Putridiphycobacter roseus]|uniref:choice-of-anchor L domain-containing protein n=1 Tax=Putridiphycobacter roseus TaxID=2219161 RepID=UPI001F337E29|nr:choice-of-anchor L domain-containing protein [Putridiphycobacter roseus]
MTSTQTPQQLVTNVLAGTGITVSNVEFNASTALAQVAQPQIGFFSAVGTTFPIGSGLILATGNAALAVGPNNSGSATDNTGVAIDPNDADLDAISNSTYNNEAILEFDFVPIGDSLEFKFIFASEEWHEFSLGINDGFAFFLSGPGIAGPYSNGGENIALLPGTTTPVTMFNVNNGTSNTGPCVNCQYLVDNTGGLDVQYDGHTVVLTAAATVQCGQTYHIKIAIGDASDQALDSGVFLEASSFSSPLPQVSVLPIDENGDLILDGVLPEGCIDAGLLLIKPEGYTDSIYTMSLTIGGTAINGTDYTSLNNSYVIPVGVDTISITIAAFLDGLVEGNETLIIGTYFLSPCGDTINIVDTLTIVDIAPDYNILTEDLIIECPTDSTLIVIGTDGGIPNIDFDWLNSNEINDSIWVPTSMPGINYYPVLATDYCGITALDSVKVTVNAIPQANIYFIADSIFTCVGVNGVNLAVDSVSNAYDPTAITYNWTPVAGTQSSINVFPTAAQNWYYLNVFDGCSNLLDSVFVQVDTAAVDSVVIVAALGCPGQTASGGSVTVYPNAVNWTYTLIGNGITTGPQAGNVFNNLVGNLGYNLVAMDPDGCIFDENILVPQVNSTLTATFDNSALKGVSCAGGNDGEAAIVNINGGVNQPTNGPYNVVWNHNNGTVINGGVAVFNGNASVNTLFGGSWQVLVVEQNSGCAWSHLFEVTDPAPLQVNVTPNNPQCFGNANGSISVAVLGGTGPYLIDIFDAQGNNLSNGANVANALIAGTYAYTVTDANGCQGSGTVDLVEPEPISVTYNKTDILCYGIDNGSVDITGVINAAGNTDEIQFYWTPSTDGRDGYGKISQSNMGPGEYQIVIIDANGCSKDVVIKIKDTTEIVLSLNTTAAFCRTAGYQSGNGVVYGTAEGGAGNYSYVWENLTTGQTSSFTTWAGRSPGDYELTVTDNNGCVQSDTVYLDSLNPKGDFTVTSDAFLNPTIYEGTEDVTVKLTNLSTHFSDPNNPLSDTIFQWNLYTNSIDDGKWFFTYDLKDKVDTTYKGEEVYQVCLVAKNYNDCVDTTCKAIIVHKAPKLDLPNVFTPGAFPNNTFFFPNEGLETLEAIVFNRYGIEVYRFTSPNDAWDGTHFKSGKVCTEGVYFYTYKAAATNGDTFEGKGTVTLIHAKK